MALPSGRSVTQCSVCQGCFSRVHPLSEGWSDDFEHHLSVKSLDAAVEAGCGLCNLVQEQFRRKAASMEGISLLRYSIHSDWPAFPQTLMFSAFASDNSKEAVQTIQLQFANTPDEQAPDPSHDSTLLIRDRIDFAREFGLPTGIYKRRMDVNETVAALQYNTGSRESLGLAKAWLRHCAQTHTTCKVLNQTGNFSMPTRLLQCTTVGDEAERVQLLDTGELATSEYATLTHRWGTRKPLELKAETENDLRQGVPLTTLPQTFQDAFAVTQALDVSYLWIDSLCIRQDSTEDWREQSLLMGQIYKHALVNIAASASEDSHQGIFRKRNPLTTAPVQLRFAWRDTQLMIERSKDVLVLLPGLWDEYVESSVVASRGWVFQERLLSSRILHFTSTQVFWECKCSNACETLPGGRPYIGAKHAPYKSFLQRVEDYRRHTTEEQPDTEASGWEPTFDSRTSLLISWKDLVQRYSMCALTRVADKLIALRSAALEMVHVWDKDDVYIAGHWLSQLPWELLWVAGVELAPNYTEFRSSPRLRTPEIAPTWSWVSMSGPVAQHGAHLGQTLACLPHEMSLLFTIRALLREPAATSYALQDLLLDHSGRFDDVEEASGGAAKSAAMPACTERLALELEGHVFEAVVLGARSSEGKSEGLAIAFGLKDPSAEFNPHAGAKDFCTFGAHMALDEGSAEQFMRPFGDEGFVGVPGKLFVLPMHVANRGPDGIIERSAYNCLGLILEEVEGVRKIEGDGKTRCFERRGRMHGTNIAGSDGLWLGIEEATREKEIFLLR